MLEVRNISIRYGPYDVVRGVTFDLRAGEIIILHEPNRVGKSTLIRSLNGTDPIAGG